MDLFDVAEAAPVQTLRPYQQDMIAAVAESSASRLLIQAATGTGKTTVFSSLLRDQRIRDRLGPGRWSMLVIAHREELLEQAAERIQQQNPDRLVTIEQGDRYASLSSDVIVASVQTLAGRGCRRLKRLQARHDFRLVVVDEAHHAPARTYRDVLAALDILPPQDADTDADAERLQARLATWRVADRLLVGVTATPNRTDAVGLNAVFESMVYSYPLRQAITDGWLVPIEAWEVKTRESLDGVKTTAGEFNQAQLAEAVNTHARNALAFAAWEQYASGVPTLAFTVDVAHAHAVAAVWESRGIAAAAVSGDTPKADRRQLLQAYRDRRITVLANCMILTEGTDLPLTGCVLHLKPTKSPTLYEQMTGRGLRQAPGKDRCIVLDVVDVSKRHSLVTAPVLYGLPPSLIAQGRLDKLAQRYQKFQEDYPGLGLDVGRKTIDDLQAMVASRVDVWSLPSMGEYAAGLTCQWLRVGDEAFRLVYPWERLREALDVSRDLVGQFSVVASWRAQERGVTVPEPQTVARGIATAQEALRVAEDYVRSARGSVLGLKSQAAPWRTRPASPKQIAALERWRIKVKPGLTAGEASDTLDTLISRAKARKG